MIQKNANVIIVDTFDGLTVPAAAVRLATEIRDAGYTCQIINKLYLTLPYRPIDVAFTDEEMQRILQYVIGPDTMVFGVSSTFFNTSDRNSPGWKFSLNQLLTTFITVKQINPNVKIMLGGPFASDILASPEVDVFMLGMADQAIIDYLKYKDKKNPFFQYETKHNKMVIHGDRFPFNFNTSQIKYHWSDNYPKLAMSLELARGCVFNCDFCNHPNRAKNKNDHIKSAVVIKEELLRNYNEFGITRYKLTDSTFNDNTFKLEQLATVAQSLPFKLEYACYMRIELLRAKPEQYQLLKDSGLAGCMFGIESLHHPSTRVIGKGLHPEKVVEELYTFADKLPTVGVCGSFICGLPYETTESMLMWTERISAKDFPLDMINMNAMFIQMEDTTSYNLYESKFEKDRSKYYTWDSLNHWHNGNFGELWAISFTNYFDKMIEPRQRWADFHAVNVVAPWTTILSKKQVDNTLPWTIKTVLANIKQYKENILSGLT